MRKILLIFLVIFLGFTIIISGFTANNNFYEGATIRIIVPSGAGGGFDTYARLIQPYLEKYLPGSKVVVENIPGAGGSIGRNMAFIAEPDGLTICLTDGSDMIYSAIAEAEGVRWEIDQWTYLARVASESSILTVPANSSFNSFKEIIDSKKRLLFASAGVGDGEYFSLGIVANIFGFEIFPVTGYAGSKETSMAAIRGEVDLWQYSSSTTLPLIKNGDVSPIVIYGIARELEVPQVPTLLEMADDEYFALYEIDKKTIKAIVNVGEVKRIIIAPPGLDEEKTNILRQALKKVFNDPDLLVHANKISRPIIYLEGEDVAELVNETMEIKELIKPILEETLKLAE